MLRLRFVYLVLAGSIVASCGDDGESDQSAATNSDGAVEAGQDGSTLESDAGIDSGVDASRGSSSGAPMSRPETPPPRMPMSRTDADGDGYTAPEDCDDADSKVHPDAAESCNGKDEDCDGATDEGATDTKTFYRDADKDGYGTSTKQTACTAPEGYADKPGDCDDGAATVHPGAIEHCDFSIDEDCDGEIDEDAENANQYFADTDADGWGDHDAVLRTCEFDPPAGYTREAKATDCNDSDGTRNGDAVEACNELDDDCDGEIDEDVEGAYDYLDADGDGYGDPNTKESSCRRETPSAMRVPNGDDCNDNKDDPAASRIHPNAADLPDDAGLDSNCDGIDGDRANAVFVGADCGCSLAGPGTEARPYCQINRALQLSTKTVFFVATGPQFGGVITRTGVSIYGGYNCKNDWTRETRRPTDADASSHLDQITTVKLAQAPYAFALGFDFSQGPAANPVLLDSLAIEGPSVGPGQASTGLLIIGGPTAREVTLHASVIRGGPGGAGEPGIAGWLRACTTDVSEPSTVSGTCQPRGADGIGGVAAESAPGRTGAPGGAGGLGGQSFCGGICGLLNQDGVTTGNPGSNGAAGLSATTPAAASVDRFGTLEYDSSWVAPAGTSGQPGLHGAQGGQGGQGGMKAMITCIPACPSPLTGGTGGGGGPRGCGGGGGTGGRPGGPSIALQTWGADVRFEARSRLEAGKGGRGGDGASGAAGTSGSAGRAGAVGNSCQGRSAANGGNGGFGGNGGNGGGGAGGNGGPSMCWARAGTSLLLGDNSGAINVASVCPTVPASLGGEGGTAGSSLTGAAAAQSGLPGVTAQDHGW